MRHLFKDRICHGTLLLGPAFILGWLITLFYPLQATWGQALTPPEILITNLKTAQLKGQGYKLVYLVEAPLEVYWRFKTDFENDFVVTNKYIRQHRLISQKQEGVVTENKYEHFPDAIFQWQTIVYPDQYRLDFKLLNPKRCRQRFHHGYIQLEARRRGTRVTQVAYFDFFGAGLWARYPWKGGMKDFLTYTARWEQETFLRLLDRYSE